MRRYCQLSVYMETDAAAAQHELRQVDDILVFNVVVIYRFYQLQLYVHRIKTTEPHLVTLCARCDY